MVVVVVVEVEVVVVAGVVVVVAVVVVVVVVVAVVVVVVIVVRAAAAGGEEYSSSSSRWWWWWWWWWHLLMLVLEAKLTLLNFEASGPVKIPSQPAKAHRRCWSYEPTPSLGPQDVWSFGRRLLKCTGCQYRHSTRHEHQQRTGICNAIGELQSRVQWHKDKVSHCKV